MTRFRRLISEIHRRSLWQVLGIYVVGSWLVLQAVDTLAGALNLPDWAPPLAFFLLVVGLPVVLATAFLQEGAGRGPSPSSVGKNEKATPANKADSKHGLFTWRNLIIGGLAAFALLGLVTAGYMVMRTLGIGPAATLVARGVLDEKAPLVLADFESDDEGLGRAATTVLRVDLSQSPNVRLVKRQTIAEALTRMARDPSVPIDLTTAQEIAQREGFQAVVAGRISQAGTGFVFSAEIVSGEAGDVLLSERTTAADSTEIIEAIDALSRKLRERIGESFGSLRSSPPLEQVTTRNLAALRKYSQALGAIDDQDRRRGIELLEEAVALDPEFAMAWRKLGVELGNAGESIERSVQALSKAFEYRDRLTERERYLTMGSYYMVVGDVDRAMQSFQNALDLDPDDTWALANLATLHLWLRQFDQAHELYVQATKVDSTTANLYQGAIFALVGQGKFEEAEAVLGIPTRRVPESPFNHWLAALIDAAQLDYDRAEAEFRAMLEGADADLFVVSLAPSSLAAVLAARGQLAEAAEFRSQSAASAEARGIPGSLDDAIRTAFVDLAIRGDTVAAVQRVQVALEAHPMSAIPPLDRPYWPLAAFYAVAGETDWAERTWAEFEEAVGPELRGGDFARVAREFVDGAIALSEGRFQDAVADFRGADQRMCVGCALANGDASPLPLGTGALYPLALAFEAAGEPDSALSTYKQLVSRPDPVRLLVDQGAVALSYERLG
ncbi:MAG: tetratricopeptide repeat protein, partial [Gemmatimonadales bacterium]